MNIKEDNDESVAIEVLQYREKIRGRSGTTHPFRPKSVLFRVGQVVGNLREGYKGVIIGWKIDPKVKFIMYYQEKSILIKIIKLNYI
jgi:hypothetical protein